MQQQRDAFCKALDPTDAGVRGRLARLDALIRHHVRLGGRRGAQGGEGGNGTGGGMGGGSVLHEDEEIWMHLNSLGVEPQFYALRWLLLMLTQEFEMPDVLSLWDSFIADSGRPLPLLYYVCVAMIIWLKPALLAGDFTACMKLLQHLPSFDPKALLSSAMRLRADDLLGSRSTVRSAPTAVAEGVAERDLREMAPFQAVDSQPAKPFPPAGSPFTSSEGFASAHSEVPLRRGADWALGEARAWKVETQAANAHRSKWMMPKDSIDNSEAALGHLKRLAGVGVEHAYKGASVVSQYLSNSGLAQGLASNITSFFSSEPGASSPTLSVAPSGKSSTAEVRHSAASDIGELSSPTVRRGQTRDLHPAGYGSSAAVAAVKKGRREDSPPTLIEYSSSPQTRIASGEAKHSPGAQPSFSRLEPPIPEDLWIADPPPFTGERRLDSDEPLSTPRSTDTNESNSSSGNGVRITIL
ncbi:tbc1 domain family member related protein [Cyclospora cayetanensis]|uniref:Tbc1 domain family member related protein n=1 Tax=Cyclospora cayetanensis TaxID=88456 RepID=A0A1D3D901_9EIME|nr:tbc1 domain family member related protein [Cyclospora cayetanensis]